jgi:hypothetical protein
LPQENNISKTGSSLHQTILIEVVNQELLSEDHDDVMFTAG